MDMDRLTESDRRARVKRAELASGIGAGALGMGLGVLFASYLRSVGAMIVLAGAALHAIGMWDKHRAETVMHEHRLWWETLMYWVCWAALGGLFVYAVVRQHA